MSGEDSRHKRTVRVLNLSEDTTEDELTTYFRGRKDGESNVQDVIMFSDKNEAHVVFKDAEGKGGVLGVEHLLQFCNSRQHNIEYFFSRSISSF